MRAPFVKWFLFTLILLLFLPIGGMKTTLATSEELSAIAENGLLVKYVESYRSLTSQSETEGVEDIEMITAQVGLLTLSDDANIDEVTAMLENDPAVDYVEPNYERSLLGTVNDPYFGRQWWVPHVKAESMWAYASSQQEKIIVAVIDSGIDANHEDLNNRIEPGGFNFYANNTKFSDTEGHGTQVAGVIAAESRNQRGISGMAGSYEVAILPLKITEKGKSSTATFIKAVNYAIEKNVDVINISLGGAGFSKIENAAIQRAIDSDMIIVAAAGNDALKGNPIFYPASYEGVISVGAVDRENAHSSFSSYNDFVDIVAPGESIYSTSPSNSYKEVKGTSFSAPIVAGAVAMIRGINPELSNEEISNLLTATARDLGPIGRDEYYGAGVLDMNQLVHTLKIAGDLDDFPKLFVGGSKVFAVAFNQHLDSLVDYKDTIRISRSADETEEVRTFTVKVDPSSSSKLFIKPTNTWSPGEYFLTITKDVKNNNGRTLKKDVKMKFEVIDNEKR